ncbi:hypothetical protein CALCODRAFT_538432, partial [Calocera cornea HHB12733]
MTALHLCQIIIPLSVLSARRPQYSERFANRSRAKLFVTSAAEGQHLNQSYLNSGKMTRSRPLRRVSDSLRPRATARHASKTLVAGTGDRPGRIQPKDTDPEHILFADSTESIDIQDDDLSVSPPKVASDGDGRHSCQPIRARSYDRGRQSRKVHWQNDDLAQRHTSVVATQRSRHGFKAGHNEEDRQEDTGASDRDMTFSCSESSDDPDTQGPPAMMVGNSRSHRPIIPERRIGSPRLSSKSRKVDTRVRKGRGTAATDEFRGIQFKVLAPETVTNKSQSTVKGSQRWKETSASDKAAVFVKGTGKHCRMADLSPTSKSLSSRSNKLFRVMLANSDAFPDAFKAPQWARKSFKTACVDLGVKDRYYKSRYLAESHYASQMQDITLQRKAQLRGEVKTVAAELLLEHYKLPLSRGPEAIADTIEQLTADSLFVYQDHWSATPQKIFEHSMIQAVYTASFFKDRRSDGVIFQRVFAEGKRPLLALIERSEQISQIHCALEQWSSGVKRSSIAHKFTSHLWKSIYEEQLENIGEFATAFPNKYKRIMRNLFTNALAASGATVTKPHKERSQYVKSLIARLEERNLAHDEAGVSHGNADAAEARTEEAIHEVETVVSEERHIVATESEDHSAVFWGAGVGWQDADEIGFADDGGTPPTAIPPDGLRLDGVSVDRVGSPLFDRSSTSYERHVSVPFNPEVETPNLSDSSVRHSPSAGSTLPPVADLLQSKGPEQADSTATELLSRPWARRVHYLPALEISSSSGTVLEKATQDHLLTSATSPYPASFATEPSLFPADTAAHESGSYKTRISFSHSTEDVASRTNPYCFSKGLSSQLSESFQGSAELVQRPASRGIKKIDFEGTTAPNGTIVRSNTDMAAKSPETKRRPKPRRVGPIPRGIVGSPKGHNSSISAPSTRRAS